MTKAFNELISSQHVLYELADPPVSGVSVPGAIPDWVKDVKAVINKCYPSTVDIFTNDFYNKTIGKLGQKGVDLKFYPVQDLIRSLYALKIINPRGELAAGNISWGDFLQAVQNNIDDTDVQGILADWKTQLQDGDYEEYEIRNAILSREFSKKKTDKEAVSVAAFSVYNNDTIYETLVKIVERRVNGLQKFEGEIARRLGNVAKYEAVLRDILNNPSQVAASVKKLPADFFKYCEITDRELIRVSLACDAFYKAEVARVISLAIARKAKEREPFAKQVGQGTAEQPVLGTPRTQAEIRSAKASSQPREKGAFAASQRELDLSSLSTYSDILNTVSFEKFTKNNIITEADMWQSISTYVGRYGGKAVQSIWSGVKSVLTGTKELPSSITEYESFLRTGIIKTTVSVPNNSLTPGVTPVFDVNIQIDSSKERINNLPVIYNIKLINSLADAPSAKEAKELRDSLRYLAEHIGKEEGMSFKQGVKAFAGILK